MARSAVKGVPELESRLRLIVRNVGEAIAQTIDDDAHDLLGRAQDLSPQLSGDHINSGKVFVTGSVTRSVGFNEPYSVFLHEGRYNLGPVSSRKPPTEDGGVGREYLLRPFENQKARYIKNVGRAVNDAVRRSVR